MLPPHALLVWVALAGAPMTSPCVKPGVSRWSVKTSLPSRRAKPVPMSLAAITALPIPASVTGNKESTTRYSDDLGGGLTEGALVRVSGWVRVIATDPDCDYHIQLTPTNAGIHGTVIVEVPRASATYEKSPELRDSATAVRDFLKARILRGKEPSGSAGNKIGKAYIEVVGQLFLDGHHLPNCDARGKQGMRATTCWEVHPVIAAHFAPRP